MRQDRMVPVLQKNWMQMILPPVLQKHWMPLMQRAEHSCSPSSPIPVPVC
jgi:hypothetical protein